MAGPDHLGEEPALFFTDGDRYVPTKLSQGPWSPDLQFGGAAAALLATAVEALPSLVPQRVARLTVDLLRPVPMRPMTVQSAVTRQGKRVSIVDAALVVNDVEVARARALRMRVGDLGDLRLPNGVPRPGPPPGAEQGAGSGPGMSGAAALVHEHPDQMLQEPTWIRLLVPVVAGRLDSALAKLAYTADFVSGVGHPRGEPLSGINADITLNVLRYPNREWICVMGDGWTDRDGIGHAQALLSDDRGVLAVATLARLVERLADDEVPPLG